MFTGIITNIGEILAVDRETGRSEWGDTRMTVAYSYDPDTIDIGASICHAGACMTVVAVSYTHLTLPTIYSV